MPSAYRYMAQPSLLRKTLAGVSIISIIFTQLLTGITYATGGVSVTPAANGTNVLIDTTTASGGTSTFTALTGGPIITETTLGSITTGIKTLSLPAGWEFNTSQNVTIGLNGSTELTLGSQVVTPSTTTLSFNVTGVSVTSLATLTFSDLQVRPTGTVVGSGNITLSSGTITSVVNGSTNFGTLSTIAGAKSKIGFTTQPSSTAIAGSALAIQPIIHAQDQYGNNRTTDTNTVTVAAYTDNLCSVSGTGTLAGTPTKIEVASAADFSGNGLNYQRAETIYLGATDGTYSVCSTGIAVSPASADHMTILTQPAGTSPDTVDDPLTTQPQVTVFDLYGNTVSNGVTVTAALVSGSGTLTGSLTANTAGGAGIATFSGLKYTKSSDAFTLKFTASGATDSSTTSIVGPLNPGAATQLVYNTQPTSSVLSTGTWNSFSINILDQYSNLTNSTANVVVAANTGSLGGTTTVAAVAGTATFSTITNTVTGNYTVTGTSTGLTPTPASSSIVVNPGALDHFSVTGITTPHAAGTPTSPVVTAFDSNNNIKTDYVGTVTITSSDVGTGTVLPGSGTYTFLLSDNGAKTFTNGLTLTTTGVQSFTATDGAVTASQTGVTVTPGAADHITFSVQPSTTVQVGVVIATAPAITVYDVYNNIRSADTTMVTLSAYTDSGCTVPAAGTLGGTLTRSELAGVADFTLNNLTYSVAEGIYLKASD
jgi:hypothetical protein